MSLFYFVAKKLTNAFIHIAFRMRYEGKENIDQRGGFMVCSNHRTVLDPLFIAQKIRPQLFFMAKQELFKNWFFGCHHQRVGCLPGRAGERATTAPSTLRWIPLNPERCCYVPGREPVPRMVPQESPNPARRWWRCRPRRTSCRWAISFEPPLRFRSVVTIRYGKMIRFEELGAEHSTPSEMKRASKLIMGRIVELVTAARCRSRAAGEKTVKEQSKNFHCSPERGRILKICRNVHLKNSKFRS